MSPKVINPKMMWGYLIFNILLMSSFLIHVQGLNSSDVTGKNVQSNSSSLETDVSKNSAPNEQHTNLTQQDKGKINSSSENKSTLTNTTFSTEPFISFPDDFSTGALVRGFYVFVGLGAIVVIYIAVRTIRLKKKKKTVRKYGILTNREDVEMTPLGAEEEEEESTLFDMTSHNTLS